MREAGAVRRIPLAVKLLYTAFVAVLVPVYWHDYGPTNFLYFCDVALLMTVPALWLENALPPSAALVGIFVPQLVWQADFLLGLCGWHVIGLTDYMFDAHKSLFLRGLSFFHFWLPLLLLWMVRRLGYDRRALPAWTALAWALLLVCYFWMPAPPPPADDPNRPVNINYVYGMRDEYPQTWMPPAAWLGLLSVGLPLFVFLPTHCVLTWLCRPARPGRSTQATPGRSGPAAGIEGRLDKPEGLPASSKTEAD